LVDSQFQQKINT